MSTVLNILCIVLVFGIIIFIHEFGHFIVAKINKITVNEFAIGMGPSIFSFTRKETKYSLKLLPIGGYCLMLGEDEEIDDENAFGNKPVWIRMLVVLAGPFFNFILAFLCSIILISMAGYDDTELTKVPTNGAAYEAGIREGDVITKLDNSRIYVYRELLVFMQFHKNDEPIDIEYIRDGKKNTVTITPKQTENGYLIGVSGGVRKEAGFFTNIKYSALEVRYWIKTTFISLKELVTGGVSVKQLSGPVGIASMMNDTMNEANDAGGAIDVFLNIVNFCILISANLGVMNLLPIPALDGGRLLFFIIEAVRRKKIPQDKEAIIHLIGFVLLIGLMAVVMFNDIKNLIIK